MVEVQQQSWQPRPREKEKQLRMIILLKGPTVLTTTMMIAWPPLTFLQAVEASLKVYVKQVYILYLAVHFHQVQVLGSTVVMQICLPLAPN